jgi:hypothetical protein
MFIKCAIEFSKLEGFRVSTQEKPENHQPDQGLNWADYFDALTRLDTQQQVIESSKIQVRRLRERYLDTDVTLMKMAHPLGPGGLSNRRGQPQRPSRPKGPSESAWRNAQSMPKGCGVNPGARSNTASMPRRRAAMRFP